VKVGAKSKLPTAVSGDTFPESSTTWTARKTSWPAKRGSATVRVAPASWFPGGGGGTFATEDAASKAACVVIGPAVEKRKSNRAARPQYTSSLGMRATVRETVFAVRSCVVPDMSAGAKRAGGTVSSPYRLLFRVFTSGL